MIGTTSSQEYDRKNKECCQRRNVFRAICWSQLSCHRFKFQFIIKTLKSVYGIEQLVSELSYASDVLRILLSVNRWVSKLRNIEIRSKTRIV